jgi:DNA-binding transcriptional LysR family regulator
VSQPPVSKAIRQLEDEVGVQLLERTRGAVALTDAGRVFADEARRILGRLDMAIAEARRAGGVTSTLRVGSLDYLPIERLQRFIKALGKRRPDLPVTIVHLPSREQIRRLRDGELDLGIFTYSEDHQEIEMRPLFAGEPIEALLPRDHRLAASRILGPDDLKDEALITASGAPNPSLYARFMTLIDRAGYKFRSVQVLEATNPRDIVLAVAASDAVMFRPLSFRAVDEAGINVIRAALDPEPAMPDTVVAWRTNPPRHLGQVLSEVREIADELREADERDRG